MPARQKSKQQRADEDDQTATRRYFCSFLKFYIACGHVKCRRARACVCDANECFLRLWPVVPEDLKIYIRAAIKAIDAGLSQAAIAAEAERELARWRKLMAPRTEPQAAAVASSCEPSPHATNPPTSGPRLRVL
jgi:hypothetical protein